MNPSLNVPILSILCDLQVTKVSLCHQLLGTWHAYSSNLSSLPIHQLGTLALSDDAANHIGKVLRMQPGQSVTLFDGSDAEFPAVISEISKNS
ncbi:RNA methyltransferase PUA domain-containing protein [Vibrio metschnikovii]